ncbi:MAG: hypothetical protein IPL46_14785 [Saprospiraceae bacterium]|nr:hypothetical protein [Saprospiraceae bacterium]
MMNRIVVLIFLLHGFFFLCQGQDVSNVITQVNEERNKVTITYDLARKSGSTTYNVGVRITLDNEVVNALALSGDTGPNISPGYGKRIIWDVLKDLSEISGNLQVTITAKSNAADCIPIKTVPVYAGLTGAAGAGLALLLSGLKLESDSKPLYDTYKSNLNPSDPVFSEISREDYYQDANSKHKKGQWFTAAGAAVIAAGGVILVSRLIQIKKYNDECLKKRATGFTAPKLRPIIGSGRGSEYIYTGLVVNF